MVEWKKLGEVVELARGVRVVKTDLAMEGIIPVYQNSLSPLGYYDIHNYPAGTTFVISAGAAGDIGFSDIPFWAADDCLGVTCPNDILNKFVFYFLQTKQSVLKSQVRKASVPRLSRTVVERLDFPCISISEQTRIVGILDTFTASIANLKEQIKERRMQYNYLIDSVFGNSYEKMLELRDRGELLLEPLSSHGVFTRGRRFVRTDVVESGMPCIHYGDMYTYYGIMAKVANTFLPYDFPKKMRYAKNGDVVIVGAGENNEDIGVGVAWLGDEPAAVHDACYIYESDFDAVFLSYYLRSSIYHHQIKSNVVRGKICSISSDGIGRALIPIYPIERQKKIVESLLPFEASIANLEAQLQEREKQYEHYRNQLLTFE